MELFLSTRQGASRPNASSRNRSQRDLARSCRFESMESRQLLAADLGIGAASGADFEFTGGPTGSLSGNVFATEAVAACDQHTTANRLAGVRVQLINEAGAVLEESLTDAEGGYHFSELIPGTYSVRQQAPVGFFETGSRVGAEGRIAPGVNQIGEILVQGGDNLVGYDFCNFQNSSELTTTLDPLPVPSLMQSLQDSDTRLTAALFEPVFVTPAVSLFQQQAPLQSLRRPEIFGGSSRWLREPTTIKAWEDDLFDSWFSTASYWDLAAANQTALVAMEPILRQAESSSEPRVADEAAQRERETARDAPGWPSEAPLQLDQLPDDLSFMDDPFMDDAVIGEPLIGQPLIGQSSIGDDELSSGDSARPPSPLHPRSPIGARRPIGSSRRISRPATQTSRLSQSAVGRPSKNASRRSTKR